jgi:hypothetical protein
VSASNRVNPWLINLVLIPISKRSEDPDSVYRDIGAVATKKGTGIEQQQMPLIFRR